MTPAAPGCLGKSAADCKGVVSAGLHVFYGCCWFVTVPQSCIDHPLPINEISGAPMKCENFNMGKWRALTCGGSTLAAWKESETSALRCFCTFELQHNRDQACFASTGEGNYSLQPFPVCSAVAQGTLGRIHILLNVLWWSLLWKIFGSTRTGGGVKVTHCLQVCFHHKKQWKIEEGVSLLSIPTVAWIFLVSAPIYEPNINIPCISVGSDTNTLKGMTGSSIQPADCQRQWWRWALVG